MKRLFVIVLLVPFFVCAQNSTPYIVHLSEIKCSVQPTMWGLFFEDINRGADGGMYAELVKNRSFDFPDPLMGWTPQPARYIYAKNDIFQVINQSGTNPDDPKYLKVTISNPGKISLANEGFGGITVRKGMTYDITVVCRQHTAGINVKVDIVNAANRSVGSVTITPNSDQNGWQTVTAGIVTTDTTVKGKLLVNFEGTGKIDIDRISLFPPGTWKNREQGLRNDLVQKLADIQPGFLRFPGGCIVEGKDIAHRYQWKKTIGPLEERKLIQSIWADDIPERQTPDYFQSFGLGFLEYFELCEDLKAEPVPILNCGLSCQFDAAEVVPVDELDPYVQDALDLVEFANGDAHTKWGAKRSALGHPAPFNMKMLGVGNENWGPQYVERLQIFTKAIKEKYPDIQLVCATGYSPNPQFHYMDSVLRAMKVDIIDEHYYMKPEWFLQNSGKYDHYDRRGPKIFVGEYAAQSIRIGSPDNTNTMLCALAEAAFMTGLERNADVVSMASYAPLFAHVDGWQWTPNLIWFDNAKSYSTPSYYVQQMFSLNKGTGVVPILLNGDVIQGQDSIWASAVIDKNTNEVIVKIVNPSSQSKRKEIAFPDLKKSNANGTMIVLKSNGPNTPNSLSNPTAVNPVTNSLEIKNKKLIVTMPPWSFNVVNIKM